MKNDDAVHFCSYNVHFNCNLIGSGCRNGIFPSEIINNSSHFSGNLLNDLRYYVNENLSVKPVFSTWITSVFITICSLEIVQFVANLAMITAVRVFRMRFVLW